jgi:hypothetical protein
MTALTAIENNGVLVPAHGKELESMKCATIAVLAALMTFVSLSVFAQVAAVPPLISFQGRLARPDGTPVADGNYSIKFTLFTAATGGTQKWTETDTVAVHNGVFAVLLGKTTALTDSLFAGNLFLEMKVGSDPALTPRQQLVSMAYAFKADTVPDGSIGTTQLKDGAVTSGKLASGIFNTTAWLLGGNSGTTGSNFLGTRDKKPLVLKVNNHQAMRYSYAENKANAGFEYRSINILGGSEVNSIAAGVVGGTIAGGGQDYFSINDGPNQVLFDFGTVGGGFANTSGNFQATVSGGYGNTASGYTATIAGGDNNLASGKESAMGGGTFNTASGTFASVLGGISNTASGQGATVAGGQSNTAGGFTSFAAGYGAQALHDGSFVWGDSQAAGFPTTGPNQFLIRAAGGVGINTNTPGFPLTFANGFGDKISLWGQSEPCYGFGIAPATLQIHTDGPGAVIDFGYGSSTSFGLSARIYGTGDFLATNDIYAVGNMHAQQYLTSSDVRYKKEIATLDNALDTILSLRGVTFDWDRDAWPEKYFREGRQVGFIAQEVEQVLPELVSTDANGYKSVAYVNVVPVLVEAMKQQQARISAQQKQIEELKAVTAENAELRARLDALSAAVQKLMAAHDAPK